MNRLREILAILNKTPNFAGGGRATNGNVLKGIERTRLAYDACN
jgi:hypothetical protein